MNTIAKGAQKSIISLSKKAVNRFQTVLAKKDDPNLIIRLGVENKGCMGLSYSVKFTNLQELQPMDEVFEQDGLKFIVDGKAFMYLMGTEIDFQEDDLSSKFIFDNPNAKGKCQCGESFKI